MSLNFYADWEPPDFDEFDSVVEQGDSAIEQVSGSPAGRGNLIARVTIVGTSKAYVQKNFSPVLSLPAGGDVFVGFWYRRMQSAASNYSILTLYNSSLEYTVLLMHESTSFLYIYARTDTGSFNREYTTIGIGVWRHIVLQLHRAATDVSADGYAAVYADGALLVATGLVDNYNYAANVKCAKVGPGSYASDGYVADFDEIKIGETLADVQPYVPPPTSESLCPERVLVLYRQDDADSEDFACHATDALGLSPAHRVGLPCSGGEILDDYATFQSEIETPLANWLADHPVLAAQATCFLVGKGVPGGFVQNGLTYSTTSRLQCLDAAFDAGMTLNPCYRQTDRLLASSLRAAGCYLAVRIDAATLAQAETIFDSGGAEKQLTETNTLYTDETAWAAGLLAQKLRLPTEAIPGTLSDDALVWGNTGAVEFGEAGSRVALVDDMDGSSTSLRTGEAACRAALSNGYAAAMGYIHDEEDQELDVSTFFECLRLESPLAEAMFTATKYLNAGAVHVGHPLTTAAFPQAGYNVYLGQGGAEAIDWSTPVGCSREGIGSITFPADLQPDIRYGAGVRRVSALGVEERNTDVVCLLEVDAAGQLQPAPLPRPMDLSANLPDAQTVRLGFACLVPPGHAEPTSYDILSDNGTGTLNTTTPIATLTERIAGRREFSVDVPASSLPMQLAVRARRDSQLGLCSEICTVPAPRQPAPPVLLPAL